MSYILDALRKADAERERDPARGIHAQPAVAPSRRRGGAGKPWGVAAGVVLALALGGWLLLDRSAPEAVAPAPVRGMAAAPAPQTVPAPMAAPVVAQSVQPAAPPMPVEAPAATRTPVVAPVKEATPVPAPAAVPAAAASAPAPDRVFALAELPPDVQRDLPKLAITGGVHSENAAQRMLIVGGQVMGEGAELAPGVVLEQIRPKTAVLKFRGWRYSVGY
jgi:general secretion pathway protein B